MLSLNNTEYVVTTKNGPVRGYIDKTEDGTYYRFKSVPFAKPPVGPLRFLPPKPMKPWTETKDCTKDAPLPVCWDYQYNIVGSEDCLYVELVTPNIKPSQPLPVMFWVGSMGFCRTLDDILDPALIVNQNIVFVRCGFRIGPFGFLSINDFPAPGNSGLKDIVMALEWVQKNISEFGGDCGNVTIFGSGSGGAAVHLMMLSPMAAGLFHKTIVQSGSALHRWALTKSPAGSVIDLAKELGIDKTNYCEIVEELKSVSAYDLMAGFVVLEKKLIELSDGDTYDTPFKPCIEAEFEGMPAFLTKSPFLILKSGNFNKVPMIIGSNSEEACIFEYIKTNFYKNYEQFNHNQSLVLPKTLPCGTDVARYLSKKVLQFYLEGTDLLTENTKKQYIQLISDYNFLYAIYKCLENHYKAAPECPIYSYVMNQSGEWKVPKTLDHLNSTGHTAEIAFLFRIKVQEVCNGSRDSVKTRSKMVKMWTNFAKVGNPTPDDNDPLLQITWDAIENEKKLHYLSISSDLTKGRNPFNDRMSYWENLGAEHPYQRAVIHISELGITM